MRVRSGLDWFAAHCTRVVVTDASTAPMSDATPRANVTCGVAGAFDDTLRAQSVDLVTVAQAVHWFERDRFCAVAHRVLKPRGVLAV